MPLLPHQWCLAMTQRTSAPPANLPAGPVRSTPVHQTDNERHRHEEDHNHAVRGEDLIVVVRWQEARFTRRGKSLLATHHNGVSKTTQQHHNRHDDIHDTEAFMVD
eukprot:382406_1